MDSVIALCSKEGLLPDTMPVLWNGAGSVTHFCLYDEERNNFGNAGSYEFEISYAITTVEIMAFDPDMQAEPLSLNLEGNVLQPGQHPYLGGFKFTKGQQETVIQVVNAYVGGCYHNVVVWQTIR